MTVDLPCDDDRAGLQGAADTVVQAVGAQRSERSRHQVILVAQSLGGFTAPMVCSVVCCALWPGAICEMLPRFDANAVWDSIGSGSVTLFMGVPTIYVKLIAAWEMASPAAPRSSESRLRPVALNGVGSAALPVSTLRRWKEISGHTLLERLWYDGDWHGAVECAAG